MGACVSRPPTEGASPKGAAPPLAVTRVLSRVAPEGTTTPDQPQQKPQLDVPAAPQADPQLMEAPNEEGRLKSVGELELIGVPPQPKFDVITALMRQMFEVPVAAVTLLGQELHFVSGPNEWGCSTQREGSFCDRLLACKTPQILVVENALEDVRFQNAAFVTGPPYLRFYAGAPLVSSHREGHRYGTLCVFDTRPRQFDAVKYAMLAHFAEIVVREMERDLVMTLQQREMDRAVAADTYFSRTLDAFHEGIILVDVSTTIWRILYANDNFRRVCDMPHLLLEPCPGDTNSPEAVDFWAYFSPATTQKEHSLDAEMLAVARRQEFSLAVRSIGNRSGDGGQSAAGSQQPGVLHMRFRPADIEQLRAGMPHIGIPSCLDAAKEAAEEGASDTAATTPRKPVYFFGLVKGLRDVGSKQATTPSPAPSQTNLSAGAAASTIATEFSLTPVGSLENTLMPAFIQMRPEVVKEVQLGPLVGTGSYGRCYRGMWQGGRVAVKIIECWEPLPGAKPSPRQASGPPPQGSQSAEVEALLGRSLSHPHIVTTFCHGISSKEVPSMGRLQQQVWIVQEYCSKGSLTDAIDKGSLLRSQDGPNLQAILAAALEIAGACGYLHSHDIIHGDLTPNNVLLTSAMKDQRRWICKVADFGLAKQVSGAEEQHSSSFGTIAYMPPELLSVGRLSKSSDVYSFGIILLEMWYSKRAWLGISAHCVLAQASSGRLPFEFPSDAPDALVSLMRRCLDLDPERRPTFNTILGEVQSLAANASRPPPPTPPTPALATQEAVAKPAHIPSHSGGRSATAHPANGRASAASPFASPFATPTVSSAESAVSPTSTLQPGA